MALTFADTHSMIAYLTKSDASEGFEQILDFLNASVIQYALTVNPTIYVSCIKQFWSSVSIKKMNDVVRLQAQINRRKVIITEDTVCQALYLDDAESIDCLPNEEIFAELARIGYKKPSTKLTFYKAVFSAQWKVSKGFSGVDTPLFKGMLVPQQAADDVANVADDDVADDVYDVVVEDVAKPTLPSPTPTITLPPPQEFPIPHHMKVEALEKDKIAQAFEITKLKQRVRRLEKKNKLKVSGLRKLKKGIIAEIDADEDVILEEVDAKKDAEVAEKDAADDEPEPAELKEVIEVVTTAKLMTEVVTAAAITITAAPSAVRKRKGVVIRDPEETATPSTIVHSKPKSKDKGKGILVEEPKPLKKQAQIEQDEAYARELEAELNKNINWDDVIEQVKRKEKEESAVLRYQALKRKPQTEAQARKNMMIYLKKMAGFKMDFFKVDAVEDFKEYTIRDYYCWLKTYCCCLRDKDLQESKDPYTAKSRVTTAVRVSTAGWIKWLEDQDMRTKELKIYSLGSTSGIRACVIKNGNKVLTKTVRTVEQPYKPITIEEKLDMKNKIKARGTLLMTLLNKDQLKFHSYQDAKLLMEAIEKRLQKLISQLEIQCEVIEQEDINLKLLRSLPSEWKTNALIWRNKAEIETINTSNTNEADNTAYGVSIAHTQGNTVNSTSVDNLSNAVICAFLASQPNFYQLDREKLEQIDPGNYIPPKPDLMFIDEQVESEYVDVVSIVSSSAVKTVESKVESVDVKNKGVYSTVKAKPVKKNIFSPPIIEDWIFNDESEVEFKPIVDDKNVRPSIKKIKFVKTTRETKEKVETPKQHKHYPRWTKEIGTILYPKDYEETNVILLIMKIMMVDLFPLEMVRVEYLGKGKIKTGTLDFDDVYFCKELNQVLLRVPRKDNIYSVDLKSVVPIGGLTCLFAKAITDESNLWQRRLRHINCKTMNKLVRGNLVRGLPLKIFENNHGCVACQKEKQHKASYKAKLVNSISKPLHMLHMDLFGPINVKSSMKKSYCLVVTDDFSRFSWVLFLATKDETSRTLKTFITKIENQLDCKVKVIRCDNGTEFKNGVMNQFYDMKGIKREFSVARTPQQNGVAERKNKTLIEAARTMLVDSKLPTIFWAEAVNTACYVLNRALVIKPHNKTPYELIRGRPPLIDFMKPFGWYFVVSKAMRVFNKRTRIVEETLNIRFLENAPNVKGNGPDWLFDINSLTISMNYMPVVARFQTNDIAGTKDNIVAGQAEKKKEPEQEYILIPICTTDPLISQGPKDSAVDAGKKVTEVHESQVSNNGDSHVNTVGPSFVNAASPSPINAAGTPSSTNSFKEHPYKRFSPFKNEFSLPNAPIMTPINNTGIFGDAYDDKVIEEKVDMNNVGHTQEECIDYDEVFTPVARIEAIRLFLAYASFKDFVVYQMDVKGAFLYEKIEEEVYVCQPPGFEVSDFPDKVYKVEKALCGLHQAPRAWKEMSTEFESLMHDKFQMSYMGELSFFLGLQVQQKSSTPMDPDKAVVKDAEAKDVDMHLYRSMIGALMYLTVSSPDITFVVCTCARFQVTLKTSHLHAMKRIFRYLKGQPKLGLWYPKDSPFYLEAYSDSDYARANLNRKSTIGGCQFLGKRLISWQCKKQTIVANSTTEVEELVQVVVPDAKLPYWGAKAQTRQSEMVRKRTERIKKPSESEGFEQIIDFLNVKPIRYALTVIPIVYASCVKQFWTTAKHYASAIICLDNNQKSNFSKYIFDHMVKHLEGGVKFLMFSRFLQVFLDKQVERMAKHKEICVMSSHTKKIFANMRRQGQGLHTDSHHTPTDTQLSLSKPQKKIKPKRKQRQAAKVHSPSSEIPVEEIIPTPSNDPLPSGKDSIQLNELMIFCTNLQQHVLELEEAKITQAKEIAKLKKRVKKLEKRKKSRPAGLRKLKKVGLSKQVESSKEKDSLGAQEDASKQRRSIEDIDQDAEIALVNEAQERMHDADMFRVDDLEGNEVFVDVREKLLKKKLVLLIQLLLLTLIAIKAAKPKVISTAIITPRAKGIVFHEQVQAHIPSVSSLKDKGKAKMIEPEKPLKKKDQIALDEKVARKLEAEMRAEMEEEEKIAREKDEANRAMVKEWDDVQAIINVDRQLAEQIQAQEREQLSIEERSKLLAELIESRRKYLAAKRVEEIKNKPPIKAQQKKNVEESLKKTQAEGSSKRATQELEKESAKKQKLAEQEQAKVANDDTAELKRCLEIIPGDDDDVSIKATPISSKSPTIAKELKIYSLGSTTCSLNINGFCKGEELPGLVRVERMTYFQDHKWYDELIDGKLKEEALMHKARFKDL
nr:hypothetical protein [Tanacetum cinerariifolium]